MKWRNLFVNSNNYLQFLEVMTLVMEFNLLLFVRQIMIAVLLQY